MKDFELKNASSRLKWHTWTEKLLNLNFSGRTNIDFQGKHSKLTFNKRNLYDYLAAKDEKVDIVPKPYYIKQLDIFLVDQYHHNDCQLPNRKNLLIHKGQILSFIKDRKKDALYPRNNQFIFLTNSNFEEWYNEKLNLMQNISVPLFGGSFKDLVAPFSHMKATSFDCTDFF